MMRDYLAVEEKRFKANGEVAARVLKVGVAPLDADLDQAQLASYMGVTALVMNSPEDHVVSPAASDHLAAAVSGPVGHGPTRARSPGLYA